MTSKRMFSVGVISSDQFMDMPPMAQMLYIQLAARADDDGFIEAPKGTARMVGASADELQLLEDNGYIIRFDSGVVAITHWNVHNTIQKDRKKDTIFRAELSRLALVDNVYFLRENVDNLPATMDGEQVSLFCAQTGSNSETVVNNMDPTCIQPGNICLQNESNLDTDCKQDGYKPETDDSKVDPQNRLDTVEGKTVQDKAVQYREGQSSTAQVRSDQYSTDGDTAEGRDNPRAPARGTGQPQSGSKPDTIRSGTGEGQPQARDKPAQMTEARLNELMDKGQLPGQARERVLAFMRATQKGKQEEKHD